MSGLAERGRELAPRSAAEGSQRRRESALGAIARPLRTRDATSPSQWRGTRDHGPACEASPPKDPRTNDATPARNPRERGALHPHATRAPHAARARARRASARRKACARTRTGRRRRRSHPTRAPRRTSANAVSASRPATRAASVADNSRPRTAAASRSETIARPADSRPRCVVEHSLKAVRHRACRSQLQELDDEERVAFRSRGELPLHEPDRTRRGGSSVTCRARAARAAGLAFALDLATRSPTSGTSRASTSRSVRQHREATALHAVVATK